jgi:hypothetical protein
MLSLLWVIACLPFPDLSQNQGTEDSVSIALQSDSDQNDGFLIAYRDTDADGYGDPNTATVVSGYSGMLIERAGDCDDRNPEINPEAIEMCDGVDNDCDGSVDADAIDVQMWHPDLDADGFGSPEFSLVLCSQPVGYITDNTDCDDDDATVNPAADEICNERDDDCSGVIDDDPVEGPIWMKDADGDGDAPEADGSEIIACDRPAGFNGPGVDCDDTNPNIHVGAEEVCNAKDDNCNGAIDDGEDIRGGMIYYFDADQDGYGNPMITYVDCKKPFGFVTDGTDCLDYEPMVNPSGIETCDGLDNDCNGSVDDGFLPVDMPEWFKDDDGDGYGNPDYSLGNACAPLGYIDDFGTPRFGVENAEDCNDALSVVPQASEIVGNLIDDDCDGIAE